MLADFNQLPDSARVWIYPASRPLDEEQLTTLSDRAAAFCDRWTAHSQPLRAGYDMPYRHFLVLAVDESQNAASGCAIDTSVHFVKTLEQELQLSLLDRTLVPFLTDGSVKVFRLGELAALAKEGRITPQTITFNPLVGNMGEYRSQWQVPAGQTWIKKYFVTQHA